LCTDAADAPRSTTLDLIPALRNDIGLFAAGPFMSDQAKPPSHVIRKEVALFAGFLFCGLVLLPILIWFVGKAVFGAYGGAGFAEFYGTVSGKIRSGDLVAWFLVLSPWLAWQVLRLTLLGWRAAAKM
jgi:hypothetical protein